MPAEMSARKFQKRLMDGSADDGGVSLLPRRRHISDLPLHVLNHILSFLPTMDAIKTAFVSQSWRGLWVDLPRLDLDMWNFSSRPPVRYGPGGFLGTAAAARFAGFVDWVLRRWFEPRLPALQCLRLRLYFFHGAGLRPLLDEWAPLVMRVIEDLHLDFSKSLGYVPEEDLYFLEGDGFHSSLVSLTLKCCKFVAAGFGSFASLKSLFLSDVVLPSEAAADLVSKCPVLEELTMYGCLVRGPLVIPGSSPRLRSLVLDYCYHDDDYYDEFSFQIYAPELSTFKFHGNLGAICSVGGLSHHPIDVTIEGSWPLESHAARLVALLKDLSSATSLFLAESCVEDISVANKPLNCLPNLKRLQLYLSMSMLEYPGVTHLLRSSSNLESLSIYILIPDPEFQLDGDPDVGNYWDSQNLPIHCLVNHLKIVEIDDYLGLENHLNFVAFLLKSSVVLEEMRVRTSLGDLAWFKHLSREDANSEFRNFSQILSSLPRASEKVVICLEPQRRWYSCCDDTKNLRGMN